MIVPKERAAELRRKGVRGTYFALQVGFLLWFLWHTTGEEFSRVLHAVRWTMLLAALIMGMIGILIRSVRRQLILCPIQKYSLLDIATGGLGVIRKRMHLRGGDPHHQAARSMRITSGVPIEISRPFLIVDRSSDLLVVLFLAVISMLIPGNPGRSLVLVFSLACLWAFMISTLSPGIRKKVETAVWNAADENPDWKTRLRLLGETMSYSLGMVGKSVGRKKHDIARIIGLTFLAAGLDLFSLWLATSAVHLPLGFLKMITVYLFICFLWRCPFCPASPGLFDFFLVFMINAAGITSEAGLVSVFVIHTVILVAAEWAAAAATAAGGLGPYEKPVLLRIKMNAVKFPGSAVPQTTECEELQSQTRVRKFRWPFRTLKRHSRELADHGKTTPAPG